MKTAAEIASGITEHTPVNNIEELIADHAEQVSIAFAEWCVSNGWIHVSYEDKAIKWWKPKYQTQPITSEELFQIFKKETNP